ncbi:hypothetical protein Z043_125424 [Scleropages formosus]|uniref:Uncharacterized protein n=1 Tax=Scleropages formosus TaxID=113540 RepID=A0A0P7T7P2_SCLFO|nr:hypothetical protein Z043_125424 [Scleropages formosus]
MPAAPHSKAMEADGLKIEEVQAPAAGTRKAKVLYDYDAADATELSLMADEVRAPYRQTLTFVSICPYLHSCDRRHS